MAVIQNANRSGQVKPRQFPHPHRTVPEKAHRFAEPTLRQMALAYQACRDGHRVGYYDTPKLLRELQNAQADGSLLSGEWATHPQTKKPPDLTSEGLKQLRLNR